VLNNPCQGTPIDKRGKFMKGYPPTFSHTSEPLEAIDWLRTVERQLDIAQCDDHEKVPFVSSQLQGTTQDWWESYQYGVPTMLDRSPGRSLARALARTTLPQVW